MKKMRRFRDLPVNVKCSYILSLFALTAVFNFLIILNFQDQQKHDALVVDVAGRNRMLSQKIGFLAERVVKGEKAASAELAKVVELHERSLQSLKYGGPAPGMQTNEILPPTPDHILSTYLHAEEKWNEFRHNANIILNEPQFIIQEHEDLLKDSAGVELAAAELLKDTIPNPARFEALAYIESEAGEMLGRNNELVKAYVHASQEKQSTLNTILMIVLIVNLLLIIVFLVLTKKYIVVPINNLRDKAANLAKGDPTHIEISDTKDEIGEVASSLNDIAASLEVKAAFAEKVGSGKFDDTFEIVSKDDKLGQALLDMGQQLALVAAEEEKRNWANEGIALFSDHLRKFQGDLSALSHEILAQLIKYINANQGAIFIVNDEDEQEPYLEMLSMYAWGRHKFISKRVNAGDDLLGQAWLEKDMLYLTEVPDDYVEISSGIGKANPTSILIVPLKVDEHVLGIIELASLKCFEKYELDFINKIAENIASVFSTARMNQKTKLLLEQSQQQTEELKAQEEEMRQNMEELAATQEEMVRKEKSYIEQIRELESQMHDDND